MDDGRRGAAMGFLMAEGVTAATRIASETSAAWTGESWTDGLHKVPFAIGAVCLYAVVGAARVRAIRDFGRPQTGVLAVASVAVLAAALGIMGYLSSPYVPGYEGIFALAGVALVPAHRRAQPIAQKLNARYRSSQTTD